MALNDIITVTTSFHGVAKTETIEYSGPDFFFIEELAELWPKTIREIFKLGVDGDFQGIEYLWLGEDEFGFDKRVFIPLSRANLGAFAKDANAEVQVSWPGKNEILTATLKDIVVTITTVRMMDEYFPGLYERVIRAEKAQQASTDMGAIFGDTEVAGFPRMSSLLQKWFPGVKGFTDDNLKAMAGKTDAKPNPDFMGILERTKTTQRKLYEFGKRHTEKKMSARKNN